MIDVEVLAKGYEVAAQGFMAEVERLLEDKDEALTAITKNRCGSDSSEALLAQLLVPYLDLDVKVTLAPEGLEEFTQSLIDFFAEDDE